MYVKSTRCALLALVIGIGLLAQGNLALGQFLPGGGKTTIDPGLPPDGVYLTPDDVHAMYHGTSLAIVLSKAQHKPFAAEAHKRAAGAAGLDELEEFPSSLLAMVSVNGSPDQPMMMNGPVAVMSLGKIGNVTGTFDTEMLAMDLSGGGVMIRESPTLPSIGKTNIMDMGGGMFHIDSFFDVFTELSLDGGNTWIPSDGSAHVNLIPEPSSLVLLGLGALACLGVMVRRRKT